MEKPNTRVILRLRPCLAHEGGVESNHSLTYKPTGENGQLVSFVRDGMPERQFQFDGVLDFEEGSERLYDEYVHDLVDHWLNGCNSTILAYGQVGSGKSFTLGTGCPPETEQCHEEGVLPRAVQQMFDALPGMEARGVSASIRVGAVEIVNDQVRDLMVGLAHRERPGVSRSISIREAPGGILLVGAELCVAADCREAQHLIEEVNARKAASSSARGAHVVYTFHLEQCPSGTPAASQQLLTTDFAVAGAAGRLTSATSVERPRVTRSKLHIVDLAASECNQRAPGGGFVKRSQEAITANKGLHALGNVLAALAEPVVARRTPSTSGAAHVPFRESKLTRLLADSLAPPARICLITCIAPGSESTEDTWATLKFAARSRSAACTANIAASLRRSISMDKMEDVSGPQPSQSSPREPPLGTRRSGISAAVDAVSKSWHTFTGALQRATGPSRSSRYLLESSSSSFSEASGLSKRTQYAELLRSKFRGMQTSRAARAGSDLVRPSSLSASSPRLATISAPPVPRATSVDLGSPAGASRPYHNVQSKVAQAWKPKTPDSAPAATNTRYLAATRLGGINIRRVTASPSCSPSPAVPTRHRCVSPTKGATRQHSAPPVKSLAEWGRQGAPRSVAPLPPAHSAGFASGPAKHTPSKAAEPKKVKRELPQRRHSHLHLSPLQQAEPSLARSSNPFPLTQAAADIADKLPKPRPASCTGGQGAARYSDWRASWKHVLCPHAPALVEGYEALVEDFSSFVESMRRAESTTDGSSRIGSLGARSAGVSPMRGAGSFLRTQLIESSALRPPTPTTTPASSSALQLGGEDRRQSDSSSGEWRLTPRCDSGDAATYLGPGLTRQVNFLITTGSVVEVETSHESAAAMFAAAQMRWDDVAEQAAARAGAHASASAAGRAGAGRPSFAPSPVPSPQAADPSQSLSITATELATVEAKPASTHSAASKQPAPRGLAHSSSFSGAATTRGASRPRGSLASAELEISDMACKLQHPPSTTASPREVYLAVRSSRDTQPSAAQAASQGSVGSPTAEAQVPASPGPAGRFLAANCRRSASMPDVQCLDGSPGVGAGASDSLPNRMCATLDMLALGSPGPSGNWTRACDRLGRITLESMEADRAGTGGDKFDRCDSGARARHLASASMDGINTAAEAAAAATHATHTRPAGTRGPPGNAPPPSPADPSGRSGQTDRLAWRPAMLELAGPSWPSLGGPSLHSPALPAAAAGSDKLDKLDHHASPCKGGNAVRPTDDDMRIEVQENAAAMMHISNSFSHLPCALAVPPRVSLNSLALASPSDVGSGGEGSSQGRASLMIRTREGGVVRVPLTNTGSEAPGANDMCEKLATDDDRDLRQSFEGDFASISEVTAKWRAIVSGSSQGSTGVDPSAHGAASTRSSGLVASIAKLFSRT